MFPSLSLSFFYSFPFALCVLNLFYVLFSLLVLLVCFVCACLPVLLLCILLWLMLWRRLRGQSYCRTRRVVVAVLVLDRFARSGNALQTTEWEGDHWQSRVWPKLDCHVNLFYRKLINRQIWYNSSLSLSLSLSFLTCCEWAREGNYR